jgi:hypothetical protein
LFLESNERPNLQKKRDLMPISSTLSKSFKQTNIPKQRSAALLLKIGRSRLTDRIKDPTKIAGSWCDSRSAEEIIANISKR